MITEKEFEYKLLLSADEHEQLENHLTKNFMKEITQTNYYFDTLTFFLRRCTISLRIREINNQFTLTLKSKKKREGSVYYREANECSWILSNDDARNIIQSQNLSSTTLPNDFNAMLQELSIDVNNLKMLGNLLTVRRLYDYAGDEICLDQNTYLEMKDFELELETFDPDVVKRLIKELEELGVLMKKMEMGKYSRFLKRFLSAY